MSRRYDDDSNAKVTRRSFLEKTLVGASVVSTGLIIGTAGWVVADSEQPDEAAASSAGTHAGMDMTSAPAAPATQEHSAEEMDRLHKEGIDAFLKNQTTPITKGKGNQPLQPEIVGGVKVFRLSVDEVDWEVEPGKVVAGRGYNGAIPGPILRATEGETVRIIVKNNLKESTSVHWHGLYVPNNMDGVPYINQEPIKTGETFTYEFTLRNSGTHMYHSHHNSLDQVNRGLLGAFIVDPRDPSTYPAYDREHIMVLNDLSLGFTINGKSFPATDAVVAKRGERVLIRYLNEGVMNHPMHLHGMPMLVFAKDGWPINPPQLCDTLDVAPGNRYDVIVEATEPGVWAFHCHILSHAEGPTGMFGLVTAMVVE
ncbi:MAG TPA: multicopper oxidase domain-containing protein [Dehalococcoidia bacterium]|nr:multicopper oxidase domain-containing protein [Dehalococcoidia bacterium]